MVCMRQTGRRPEWPRATCCATATGARAVEEAAPSGRRPTLRLAQSETSLGPEFRSEPAGDVDRMSLGHLLTPSAGQMAALVARRSSLGSRRRLRPAGLSNSWFRSAAIDWRLCIPRRRRRFEGRPCSNPSHLLPSSSISRPAGLLQSANNWTPPSGRRAAPSDPFN